MSRPNCKLCGKQTKFSKDITNLPYVYELSAAVKDGEVTAKSIHIPVICDECGKVLWDMVKKLGY
jgi:hypothetical protein